MTQVEEYEAAVAQNADRWVPACGGKEVPMRIGNSRYLYCFNPRQMKHAYLNLDTDTIVDFDPTIRLNNTGEMR